MHTNTNEKKCIGCRNALGKVCEKVVWDLVADYKESDFPNTPTGKKYGEYKVVCDCPCHSEKKCEHKKALTENGIDYPSDYVCRACNPSSPHTDDWKEGEVKMFQEKYGNRLDDLPIISYLLSRLEAQRENMAEKALGMKPSFPEVMQYVAMVEKASKNGKYDEMYKNGYNAALEDLSASIRSNDEKV